VFLSSLLKYRTNRLIRKSTSKRNSIAFNEANKIGIVYTSYGPETTDTVELLVDKLKKDGKQVKVLVYERNTSVKHLPFDTFTGNDINFWCQFKNDKIINFIDQNFDFLFFLDERPNIIIKNILAKSKAKCIVGKYSEENEALLNLMVMHKKGETADEIVNKIYHYAKLVS